MDTSLSARLELLISHLGVKQKDFAEKTGFTQAYISMILRGSKTNPSNRFFDAVSHRFFVNPIWLREGKGEIFSSPELKLSPADSELLAKYRLLPPSEQAVINEVVNAFIVRYMSGGEKRD